MIIVSISNFDLSRTMFAQTHLLFCVAFSKATALRVAEPRGFSALGISFVSFSLCLFWQRKAAKEFWYQKIVCLV